MLLTMEEEYKRNHENLPNPERIYKVATKVLTHKDDTLIVIGKV